MIQADSAGLQQLLLAALLAPQRLGVPPSDALTSRKLAAAARVRNLMSTVMALKVMMCLSIAVHLLLCFAEPCAIGFYMFLLEFTLQGPFLCGLITYLRLIAASALQEYLLSAAKFQPTLLPAMRRCIAAHLAAQPVLQQSLEAPAGADSRALWSGNLPATAALLRGLILLADTKFDGEMMIPAELLRSLPQRCGSSQ